MIPRPSADMALSRSWPDDPRSISARDRLELRRILDPPLQLVRKEQAPTRPREPPVGYPARARQLVHRPHRALQQLGHVLNPKERGSSAYAHRTLTPLYAGIFTPPLDSQSPCTAPPARRACPRGRPAGTVLLARAYARARDIGRRGPDAWCSEGAGLVRDLFGDSDALRRPVRLMRGGFEAANGLERDAGCGDVHAVGAP